MSTFELFVSRNSNL